VVPVIYAPEAERDLDGITVYIAKDNPKAAEQFGYRLIARAELLGTFPKLGRPVHGKRNVRVLLESPFKFTIAWGPVAALWRFCASGTHHVILIRSTWVDGISPSRVDARHQKPCE
jgi:plasmid stabilization system protein ParE